MQKLSKRVEKVRSKNAGPFWLTIDIFCGDREPYAYVCQHLTNVLIADILHVKENTIKRFEITSLNVVKISLHRPHVQGSIRDRDMHGASWAALIGEIEI